MMTKTFMTINQYNWIAFWGLLNAKTSHSLVTPPSVLISKNSNGKLFSAFSPDGYFDTSYFPAVPGLANAPAGLSSSAAHLDSLAQIGDAWTSNSFEYHAATMDHSLQMPLLLDEASINGVGQELISFGSSFSHMPSFDTNLADKLMDKVMSSKEAIVDSIHYSVPTEFPELPFKKAAADFIPGLFDNQVIMGGPKPDVTMAVGSNTLSDIITSTLSSVPQEEGEVAQEMVNQVIAATVAASSETPVTIDSLELSVTSSPESVQEGITNLASMAQEQSRQIAETVSSSSPLSLQELTSSIQQHQAQIGAMMSDITANAVKLSEKLMPVTHIEERASGLDSIGKESMTVIVQGAGATLGSKGNEIFESSSRSVQAAADKPVNELGESGAQLLTKLAEGMVSSLESISKYLSHFWDSLVQTQTGSSTFELLEGAQASIHKVVAGGVEAVLSTINGVGDITVREMVQSLVSLVVLVVKVLFQLVSTLVAAASGKSVTAWIEETNAAIQHGALALNTQAEVFTTDLSHKSLAEMLGMVDSYLHASTTYMADSVGAVIHMGEAAGTMAAPFASAILTESISTTWNTMSGF